jgi:hypothetical protein
LRTQSNTGFAKYWKKSIAVIFKEFGIDKTGDVLDSAQAGSMFEEMYVEAILNPDNVEESVESVLAL